MYRKHIISVGIALVLASSLGTGAFAARKHIAKAGGAKSAANVVNRKIAKNIGRAKGTKIPTGNSADFGANGPYVGVKYVGKQ